MTFHSPASGFCTLRLAGDVAAQTTASAELIEFDEAIATVLANLALRNAAIARLRLAAA